MRVVFVTATLLLCVGSFRGAAAGTPSGQAPVTVDDDAYLKEPVIACLVDEFFRAEMMCEEGFLPKGPPPPGMTPVICRNLWRYGSIGENGTRRFRGYLEECLMDATRIWLKQRKTTGKTVAR